MASSYQVYKGLQKPLIYKGFKGRFIYWGLASLICGLVSGGLLGAVTNMYLGGFFTLVVIGAGLALTAWKQKEGLHAKTRFSGILVHPAHLKISCFEE